MQAEKVAQERQLLTKIHCLPVSSIPVYALLGLYGARNTKVIIFQLLSTLFKIHPQRKKEKQKKSLYEFMLPNQHMHLASKLPAHFISVRMSRAWHCLSGPYRTIIHTQAQHLPQSHLNKYTKNSGAELSRSCKQARTLVQTCT